LESAGRLVYRFALDGPSREAFERLLNSGSPSGNSAANFIPHQALGYVLNPAARIQWPINKLGFRGPEIPREKPKGTFRIVCLGGSTTFGIGELNDENTYPRILEQSLNTYFKGSFQVINAGTPGWTSREGLANLKLRLLDLAPDMIVIYEGLNDLFAMGTPDEGGPDYQNFRRPYEPPLGPRATIALRFTHLLRLFYFAGYKTKQGGVPWDINSLASKPRPENSLDLLNKSTGKYFERNLESMAATAEERNIRPIFVTMGHGPYHPALARNNEIVRRVSAKTGSVLVDFEKESAGDSQCFAEDQVHLLLAGNQRLVSTICQKFANSKILELKQAPQ
jgi:lysophospholipase L1-like esterase